MLPHPYLYWFLDCLSGRHICRHPVSTALTSYRASASSGAGQLARSFLVQIVTRSPARNPLPHFALVPPSTAMLGSWLRPLGLSLRHSRMLSLIRRWSRDRGASLEPWDRQQRICLSLLPIRAVLGLLATRDAGNAREYGLKSLGLWICFALFYYHVWGKWHYKGPLIDYEVKEITNSFFVARKGSKTGSWTLAIDCMLGKAPLLVDIRNTTALGFYDSVCMLRNVVTVLTS